MALKWLSYTRRASQRLGFLKYVLEVASTNTSGLGLADGMKSLITAEISLSLAHPVADWLRGFGNRGAVTSREEDGRFNCEIQAVYVHGTPSRSGWLSPKGVQEYLDTLPRKLGMVDASNALAEPGAVFHRTLVDALEVEALTKTVGPNPLILTPEQAFYVGYYLILADGDFLIPLMSEMRSFGDRSFTYLDAGQLVPSVIEQVMAPFRRVAYLDEEQRKLSSLAAAREQVLKDIASHRERDGSGSKREQIIVPRLEWLVDLGILSRPDLASSANGYQFTLGGLRFVDCLSRTYERLLGDGYPDDALPNTLNACFASAMSKVSGHNVNRSPLTRERLVQFLIPTYERINSLTGFCMLRPLTIAATALSLHEGADEAYEYDDFVESLRANFENTGDPLYYTIDRLSTDYQVKFA